MPRNPNPVDDMHYDFPAFDEPAAYQGPEISQVTRVASIGELDLESELLKQFYDAQDELLAFRSAPLNQKAQAMTLISSLTREIIKQQEAVHNIEKVKAIESALVATLKQFPDIKQEFIQQYGKALKETPSA